MGRIKPQALLIQSKKKKGPAKISLKTIVTCNLVLIVSVLSLYATYKHWNRRPAGSIVDGINNLEDSRGSGEVNADGRHSYVILNTSKGAITVELSQDASYEIVDKFLALCQKGYFNGMLFHRVIKHYVIQGGDVQNLGTVEDWTSKAKSHIQQHTTQPRHEAFMLGTSKTKEDGNEFPIFITTAPIAELNEKLTVFGQVIKGEDVVQEIEEVDTDEHYRPKSPVSIVDVTLKT